MSDICQQRIVLVTGGNRGIGLQVVRSILHEKADYFVFLGCRNLEQGTDLANELCQTYGQRVEAVLLEVTNADSIARAAKTISSKCHHIDILVNNVGILLEADGVPFSLEAVHETMRVNYEGVLAVTTAFLPLLLNAPHGGQVLTTSSGNGTRAAGLISEDDRQALMDLNLDVALLSGILSRLVEDLKDPNHTYHCIPQVGYGLSKMGVNFLTQVFARMHTTVRFNACSPGFCNTDMCANYTGSRQPKEPALGATVFKQVLFGELGNSQTGKFFKENSKPGTPLDQAVSVMEPWVASSQK